MVISHSQAQALQVRSGRYKYAQVVTSTLRSLQVRSGPYKYAQAVTSTLRSLQVRSGRTLRPLQVRSCRYKYAQVFTSTLRSCRGHSSFFHQCADHLSSATLLTESSQPMFKSNKTCFKYTSNKTCFKYTNVFQIYQSSQPIVQGTKVSKRVLNIGYCDSRNYFHPLVIGKKPARYDGYMVGLVTDYLLMGDHDCGNHSIEYIMFY